MKKVFLNYFRHLFIPCWVAFAIFLFSISSNAQDTTVVNDESESVSVAFPIKIFESTMISDNQTVLVPVKKTLEMNIMHRFGIIENGYDDFWGLFAPSNIRLGINYTPIENLNLGIGITKNDMMLDLNAKYAIFKQTKGKYPVSISFYTNMAIDTRKTEDVYIYDGKPIMNTTDRFFYFNQLLIARKISNKISVQLAPSLTHQNAVSGYYSKNDSTGKEVYKTMKNDHWAISMIGRYKITPVSSVFINYDQPLTKHPDNNPHPNLSFGIELSTESHSFQFFFCNYYLLNPQKNNLFNENNPISYTDNISGNKVPGNKFLFGFNISRFWNYDR